MAGRYLLRLAGREIQDRYGVSGPADAPAEWQPRYNIAPGQIAPVVRAGESGRELAMLKWGFVPSWAEDPASGFKMINARAENVASSPAYRGAFRKRRCLVPADGFYAWRTTGDGKTPYLIEMKDGAPFALAGLWERWSKGEPALETFTIITCAPNALVRELYSTMPVILDREVWDAWLHSADTTIPQAVLQPYPAARMRARVVSKRVNKPENDDASVIDAA